MSTTTAQHTTHLTKSVEGDWLLIVNGQHSGKFLMKSQAEMYAASKGVKLPDVYWCATSLAFLKCMLFLILMCAGITAQAQTTRSVQCTAITKSTGKQCTRMTASCDALCWQHCPTKTPATRSAASAQAPHEKRSGTMYRTHESRRTVQE